MLTLYQAMTCLDKVAVEQHVELKSSTVQVGNADYSHLIPLTKCKSYGSQILQLTVSCSCHIHDRSYGSSRCTKTHHDMTTCSVSWLMYVA